MPEGFSNNIKSNSVFAYVDILFQFFCKVYRIACFTTSCFYSHIYDLCKIYCTLFLQIHDLILKKVHTCLSLQNYTLCLLSIIERRISSKSLKLWIAYYTNGFLSFIMFYNNATKKWCKTFRYKVSYF